MSKVSKRPGRKSSHPESLSAVGRMLAKLRQQAGLTQGELAERSGIHRRTIERIEAGHKADPNWSTIRQLAVALGVSASVFPQPEPHPKN